MLYDENSFIYQIQIKGHLDEHWMRWFEGLTILQQPNGETIITGLMDQAALHSILNRIRDLGLELISVQRTVAGNNTNKRKIQ